MSPQTVARLALGTYHLTTDRGVAAEEAHRLLRRAYELGIDLVDTAPRYAGGEAEGLVGDVNEDAPFRVATKVGRFEHSIVSRVEQRAYRDRALMTAQLTQSMRLLRRRRVESLIIHEADWDAWWPDGAPTADSPVVRFLREARRSGLADTVGFSGRDADRCAELLDLGVFDVVLAVHRMNVVWRDLGDVLRLAGDRGMERWIGAIYRQGLLIDGSEDAIEAYRRTKHQDLSEAKLRLLRRLRAIADEAGMPLWELSLRWCLHRADAERVLVGARSVAEVEANVAAAGRGPLPPACLRAVESSYRGGHEPV